MARFLLNSPHSIFFYKVYFVARLGIKSIKNNIFGRIWMKNKKNKNECDVHGAPHKGANRTLLAIKVRFAP